MRCDLFLYRRSASSFRNVESVIRSIEFDSIDPLTTHERNTSDFLTNGRVTIFDWQLC